jgi:Right handed beta helix region
LGTARRTDTAAIADGVTAAAVAGKVLYFPAGRYKVVVPGEDDAAIALTNNSRLRLNPAAHIECATNAYSQYAVIGADDKTGVNICGGHVVGDWATHIDTIDGEWGMGIRMRGCTRPIIQNVTCTEAWGDGIFIHESAADHPTTDAQILNSICTHNRRTGLVFDSADGVRQRLFFQPE